jgi:hypothetical protein
MHVTVDGASDSVNRNYPGKLLFRLIAISGRERRGLPLQGNSLLEMSVAGGDVVGPSSGGRTLAARTLGPRCRGSANPQLPICNRP